jgi:hypothetical protein
MGIFLAISLIIITLSMFDTTGRAMIPIVIVVIFIWGILALMGAFCDINYISP